MSSRRPEDLLAPIQLRLDFEYRQLLDISPQLLQLIVEEPLQFQEAVRYSVYGLIRSHLKDAGLKPIDINQLHAHWRLVGLPFTPGLQFEPRDQLTRLGLSQIRGILAAFTPQETLVSVLQFVHVLAENCNVPLVCFGVLFPHFSYSIWLCLGTMYPVMPD